MRHNPVMAQLTELITKAQVKILGFKEFNVFYLAVLLSILKRFEY